MEIPARSFVPKTTRNHWAWGFAWASLAVFLFWNLMPHYRFYYPDRTLTEHGMVMMNVWPGVFGSLSRTLQSTPAFRDWRAIIASLGLIFLGSIQFLLAPLWRMISMSRLFRWIPAMLCLLGFLPDFYGIYDALCDPETISLLLRHSNVALVFLSPSLIALNFLLSALALLLYHPEPEPIPAS